MNRELKRVTIVALLMFLTLFVSTTIIQYVQAEALAADPRNSRTLYESYSVERGPILVGGDPIAYSQPSDDDYKFQRVYSNGPLYAPVTGYIPVNGEATGLERSLNSYLSGQSSSQFFDQLNRLISGQDPMGASVEVAIDPVAAAGRVGRARRLHGRGDRHRALHRPHPRDGHEAHLRPERPRRAQQRRRCRPRTTGCSPTRATRCSTGRRAAT